MKQARVYDSFLIAQFAAEYLRANGIPALALQPNAVNEIFALAKQAYTATVYIAPRADEAETARLLDEFDANPANFEEGWEDRDATPDLARLDLSKLPDDVVPVCPACGYELSGRGDEGQCPECARTFDLIDLIVHAYGPEALADCYAPDERADLTHADLIPVSCDLCGYSLVGLPQEGDCPECGVFFDKRDLIDKLRGL